MRPNDAALAVTYRCNARCVMCGIWKGRKVADPPAEMYRNLPDSLRSVNVTGGEPFLRKDLLELVETLRETCPRADVVISTNGLMGDYIVAVMRRLDHGPRRVGLAISVDGIGDMHDEMRGVPGAFAKAQATLRRLAESGLGGVRLAFTATPLNVQHFSRVYDLSRQFGVEFTCAVAQGSEHYFQVSGEKMRMAPEVLEREMAPVIRAELATSSLKRWARAYFMRGLLQFASGRGRLLPCAAGRDFFFVDPAGDVYPCNVLSHVMGNLNEQSFDELWSSSRAERAREGADACRQGCWMVCTARSAIRGRRLPVLGWALAHKLMPRLKL